MKKNLFILALLGAILFGIVPFVSACHLKRTQQPQPEEPSVTQPAEIKPAENKILATMNGEIKDDENTFWVGTFQIVWNEVIDNIIHHPLEFIGGTTQTAKDLNNREFNKTDISEDSYYTKYGIVSPELKKEIERGIKEKFNETSDILGDFDFTYNPDNIFIYAMLKKDFKFLEPFDKLNEYRFGKYDEKVKYFGIDGDSERSLYKNVSVLFYNNRKDYAVKLHTKTNDEVILYRTDEVKKFNEYYKDIETKSQEKKDRSYFGHYDRLKVPEISMFLKTNFEDVEGKAIKDSNFRIGKTVETIDFKMDNEGVKLKSEAGMMLEKMAIGGPPPEIRYFYFDDKFVLFLKEKDKNVPYFAMRVTDVASLNKTGKK